MNFTGKVVLITGAASGMGAELAKQMASLGASLALVDVNQTGLTETGRECGGKYLLIHADVTKDDEVHRIVHQTLDEYGRLDVLANVAGIVTVGGIETATLEDFDRVFAVNIRGIFNLTRLCVPHLIQTKGSIVNVSSMTSFRVTAEVLVYSLTKVALDHFTKSLAVELGPKGVRVNAINPGTCLTPMYSNTPGENAKKIREECLRMTPLGRVGTPSDMAKAMIYLTSENAGYVTGVTLSVDGGANL